MKTDRHEVAVNRVKSEHADFKLKRKPREPNMGRTKKKMGKENNERLDDNPTSQNGYSTKSSSKASAPKKHKMEALTQESGMRTPKRSRY